MLPVLLDLFAHQAHADAVLSAAIRRHETAAQDKELRTLIHHILIAHRFWLLLMLKLEFDVEAETKLPGTMEEVVQQYQATQALEAKWLASLREADLACTVKSPYFPDRKITLSDALMQVAMHSHGHRAQCSARLRQLGGEPPAMDYILWLKDRPAPVWD